MKKGDLILVPFPFTNLTGEKKRPALVLIHSEFDVTVCFISTKLYWQDDYDIILQPSSLNGLKTTSLIRLSKIATIDKTLVLGKLGELHANEIYQLNINLKELLQLE